MPKPAGVAHSPQQAARHNYQVKVYFLKGEEEKGGRRRREREGKK